MSSSQQYQTLNLRQPNLKNTLLKSDCFGIVPSCRIEALPSKHDQLGPIKITSFSQIQRKQLTQFNFFFSFQLLPPMNFSQRILSQLKVSRLDLANVKSICYMGVVSFTQCVTFLTDVFCQKNTQDVKHTTRKSIFPIYAIQPIF